MNKYFFLRTLPIFISLIASNLAYGMEEDDLKENNQANTVTQSQPLSKEERKAAKKEAKAARKVAKKEAKAARKAAKKEAKAARKAAKKEAKAARKEAKLRQKAQQPQAQEAGD